MSWLLNIIYLVVLALAAPWLLWRRWRRGKRVGGLWAKLTGQVSPITFKDQSQPIWLHAVSVGEVLLLQPVIRQLQSHYPSTTLYLSVTTATGREVAEKTYPDLRIIWFPFDFSWAVHRALEQVNPRLILLAELELWPNFISIASTRNIPMVVVNGRMSERSFKGYLRFQWLTRKLLGKIDCFAVQQQEYAHRLQKLGMPQDRIVVTGSVKFDGVTANRHHPAVQTLRTLFSITENHLVWVVGSTQSPEESWALDIYQDAKSQHPDLILILVPRHQERFNDVAKLIDEANLPFTRRSSISHENAGHRTQHSGVILIDTLGELRTVWGLADIGFVGGSFNDRGGQNMIEPAAYGVAVTFGPNTWNFKQIVKALIEHRAAIQVKTKEEWHEVTLQLLADAAIRHELGKNARNFVAGQQGATERTMSILRTFLTENAVERQSRTAA